MNERIKLLAELSGFVLWADESWNPGDVIDWSCRYDTEFKKFAELIVREMCGLMEQAEDDAYHCFEPSERPTEYIAWLNQWRTRFEEHFGVD